MKDAIYRLRGSSVPLPPFLQYLLKFVPYFPPLGSLEEVFHVFIHVSVTSWALIGVPCYSIFHDCAFWQLCIGKSVHPSLSRHGGSLCGKLNRVLVYKMVSVLVESGYLVPVYQKTGR